MNKILILILGLGFLPQMAFSKAKCNNPPCADFSGGLKLRGSTPKQITELPYKKIVLKYSEKYKVPVNLIYATMWAQSKFDTNLKAPKVAGLFQGSYYIVDKYYPNKKLTDPDFAIMLGTKDLAEGMKKHTNPTNIYISAFLGDDMLKDKRYLKQPSMVRGINEFNDAYSKLLKANNGK